jgi:hypothetical protein
MVVVVVVRRQREREYCVLCGCDWVVRPSYPHSMYHMQTLPHPPPPPHPAVRKLGEDACHQVDKEADGRHVPPRNLPEPAVLHFDGQFSPVLVPRDVHLALGGWVGGWERGKGGGGGFDTCWPKPPAAFAHFSYLPTTRPPHHTNQPAPRTPRRWGRGRSSPKSPPGTVPAPP